MIKVLFVYPDINIKGGAKSFQFGIGHISSYLKAHGYAVDLFYLHQTLNLEGLQNKIEVYQPDIIAFTATTPQFQFVKKALDDLKPFKGFVICGGPHVTLDPKAISLVKRLDAICIGEGELPMLELCRALEGKRAVETIFGLYLKKDGEVIKNQLGSFIENLDELPFPDRALFDYQEVIDSDFSTALFMFSRGCPYNCTFCANHALKKIQEGKYVRFRSVDNCLAEIEQVINKYNVKTLYFNDDVFTLHKKYVFEFLEKYKKRFSLPFHINARVESIDKELCDALKAAGCRRVNFGIECGHEEFRAKVLGRNMSNETIKQAFKIASEAGLKTKSFNIVGFPGETKEIFSATIALNAEIKPDSLVIYIYEPYPGTDLMNVCLKQQYVESDYYLKPFKPRTDTVLKMPNFSNKEIRQCYKNFGFNVYKNSFLKKAIFYKLYYSDYGDIILKIVGPFKKILRKLFMKV